MKGLVDGELAGDRRGGGGPPMWHRQEMPSLYDSFQFDADVPFYEGILRRAGGDGTVLELGCGTGRLTLRLARTGYAVVGIDSSATMLERAGAKLSSLDASVQSRVELICGDITTFDLGRRFDLVVVPAKTFFYLTTDDAQHAVLDRIRRHLAPAGLLVLDLLNPTLEWMGRRAGSVVQDVAGLDGSTTVLRTETTVSTDLGRQLRTTRSVYEVISRDGSVRKHVVEWELRYVHRYEVEHLLARHGLEVTEVLGNYDGAEFGAGSPVMLVAARPDGV